MPPIVFFAHLPALIQLPDPHLISDRPHVAQVSPPIPAKKIEVVEPPLSTSIVSIPIPISSSELEPSNNYTPQDSTEPTIEEETIIRSGIEVVEPPLSASTVPIPISISSSEPESLNNSPPQDSAEPTIKEKTAIPSVVEVYYDTPESSPLSEPTNPMPTATNADSLGESISVGSNSNNPPPIAENPPISPPQNPVGSVATNQLPYNGGQKTVVGGLNLLGSAQKGQSAKIVVKEKETQRTQEFILDLTPASPTVAQNPNEPATTQKPTSVVEVIADRQEYNDREQIVTAQGNVEVRFPNGILLADRVQVNLPNRLAVAEGKVILNRGNQVLRGDRFEYYFVQDSGVVFNANGEIYQPTAGSDFSPSLPDASNTVPTQTLNDRLALTQPLQRITTGEGYRFVVGGSGLGLASESGDALPTSESGGQINRVRFQADRIDFEGSTWEATNVRLTNDPFSPPELEVRADKATFRNLAPLVDEVTLTNSRMVFDQWLSLPTFQDRFLLDRRDRKPGLFNIAFDGNDRGGLYIERSFTLIDTEKVSFQVTPQYLIQKSLFPDDSLISDQDQDEEVEDESGLSPSVFGLTSELEVNFSPRTTLRATANLPSLDVDEFEDNARAQVRLQQKVGNLANPYLLNLEYNYRERLFNGTLGFQTVNSSIGALITSPEIPLGETGIKLKYQGSVQSIVAATDRQELLEPDREDNLVTLTRFQGAASLSRSFILWAGEALPPTAEEGLRYTPTPVLPFLILNTQVTGVASFYSNGDSQPVLTGTVSLLGQIGHFSRPFFDYTGFNVSYSQSFLDEQSPFFFDRVNDQKTFSWGITQQVYGPIRVGFQNSINVETSEEISTDYFIEYSRRTYNILVRYNPVLEVGSINLRISDFNWNGNPGAFEGTGIRPVVGGVTR